MLHFFLITFFLHTNVLSFIIKASKCLTFLGEMNNTIFSQTERIQLLENMMNEQAKQISKLVETCSGLYLFFKT